MTIDFAAAEHDIRALITAERFEEADARLKSALSSGTGPIPLWRMWVHVLRQLRRPREALPLQRLVVDAVPGDFSARYDLAELLLTLGEFDEGWRAYRFRYGMTHTVNLERKVQGPRWSGENLAGRTLLVHDEQGYGDTFQFMRLLPLTRQRSQARVVFTVNRETLSLARRCLPELDAVIDYNALPPRFDAHCELMSLPMALRLQLSDLPGRMPYLTPDRGRVETWRRRLAKLPRPLVALAWAGRPTHVNDATRSMTLDRLAGLGRSGVHFVSIQKGPAAAQARRPPPGLSLTSLSDQIADFEDTAAILSQIDGLVSIDSSPVHLAGALGCRAWVMLPYVSEWRWLSDRADTPWYPQHRLFHQRQRHEWRHVVDDIADALSELR